MTRLRTIRRIAALAALGLTAVAIIKELSKPAEQREWAGEVAGLIPYDFRPPTFERARSRWWNRDDERLIVPQVFGIGWTVNIARLAGIARMSPAA